MESEQVVWLSGKERCFEDSGGLKELEEELGKGFEGVLMESMGEEEKEVLKELDEIEPEESLSEVLLGVHLINDSCESLHSDLALGLGVMFEGPNHTINEGFEGLLGNAQKDLETILDHALDENEDVFSGLNKGYEVLGDHR